ncbi:MAG: hypothetical protein GW905_01925 [Rhodobacterales bacterium]|nr:hypothetical protein [Rhodobacterales bacterium]
MTRHIVDMMNQHGSTTALLRFLRIERQQGRPQQHPGLARAPRRQTGAQRLVQFCRIDRQGPGRV